MTVVDFWFDPVSPFVHLAFERLPQVLAGHHVLARYRPLLLAAVLAAHGQKGPAEIAPKRAWTTRHVAWLAQRGGVPLAWPAVHPFNPLPLLRLALACASADGTPSRHVVERVLHHVWHGGADPQDAARLAVLEGQLQPARDPRGEAVKQQLRADTDEAIALGVFGVPSFVVGNRVFWGNDALEMLAACVAGDPWFDGWAALQPPTQAVQRR